MKSFNTTAPLHSPQWFIDLAKWNRSQDMLEGGYFEMYDGKACSVGCINHQLGNRPNDFETLAEKTGYPVWAHEVQEAIFENLPTQKEKAKWHVQFFTKAATVTDWVGFYHAFMIRVLEIALPHDNSDGQVVRRVIDLHKRGPEVTEKEWRAARAAALDAARAARPMRSMRDARPMRSMRDAYRQMRDDFLEIKA